jgi:hypothetical protein
MLCLLTSFKQYNLKVKNDFPGGQNEKKIKKAAGE